MPSYPASVKTFTAKTAGQNIDPAHVNDIQDEINAIEAGLLNGTARLNSSGSTMTSLQVDGSTFSSNITVNGLINGGFPYVRVTGVATDVASNNSTFLAFTAQRFISTSVMHSTATNPSRLLAAAASGVYQITGNVTWSTGLGSTGGEWRTSILIDGTTAVAHVQTEGAQGIGNAFRHCVTTLYRFASTSQYAQLQVFQNSGSTASIRVTDEASPDFMMVRVG